MRCSNCGTEVEASADHCSNCGAAFVSSEQAATNAAASSFENLPLRWIVLGSALLSVVGLPYYYMTISAVQRQQLSVSVIALFVVLWIVVGYLTVQKQPKNTTAAGGLFGIISLVTLINTLGPYVGEIYIPAMIDPLWALFSVLLLPTLSDTIGPSLLATSTTLLGILFAVIYAVAAGILLSRDRPI